MRLLLQKVCNQLVRGLAERHFIEDFVKLLALIYIKGLIDNLRLFLHYPLLDPLRWRVSHLDCLRGWGDSARSQGSPRPLLDVAVVVMAIFGGGLQEAVLEFDIKGFQTDIVVFVGHQSSNTF